MRNIWFTFCFLLISFSAAMAQNTITGTVVDTSGTSLPSATVLVLNPADESLVSFGLTDGIGAFKVQRVPKGEYLLRVTYIGYANLDQKISFERL